MIKHEERITKIIKFKTSMLRSNLCDYSNAYILIKGTINFENTETQHQPDNTANKKVTF